MSWVSRRVRCRSVSLSGNQIVEVAVAGALDERGDLGEGVDQRWALRVARVADRDAGPIGQLGELDAVAARIRPAALLPGQGGELSGRNPVMWVHVDLS